MYKHTYSCISHCRHTHSSKIAAVVVRNYISEVERALFPNVRDFIVSGHRQTCSFSRGPSQHFTWLDSIWRESRRALITVQRRCKVCMSACVCGGACNVHRAYVHFKNSFCFYSSTFQNKGRPYLYVSFLIGWGCGCITGELEDIMWEHYAICFSLSGSLFCSLFLSVSPLLVVV